MLQRQKPLILKEIEPLPTPDFANQDKLLQAFYGLMPKSATLLNLADSRITNLVMIHIPDNLVSFYNVSRRSNASVTTNVDTTDCERLRHVKLDLYHTLQGMLLEDLQMLVKKSLCQRTLNCKGCW